ncbi:MAG: Crp/Fnr family transcriptional regulator [Sphingomonadaceae bacterium]
MKHALPDAEAVLAEIPLFAGLPADTLAAIARRMHAHTARRGETLIRQGDPGDTLLIVLEGHLKVVLLAASGREIVLDFPGPGAVVGEIAILDGGPRTASVVAVEDSRLLLLHRRDLLAGLRAHPDAAIALLEATARRLRETDALIEGDRSLPMASRLARALLRLAKGDGDTLRARLSQGELGAFAGLSRENVNRQLKEWEAEGLVRLESGRMVILDREALAAMADWME